MFVAMGQRWFVWLFLVVSVSVQPDTNSNFFDALAMQDLMDLDEVVAAPAPVPPPLQNSVLVNRPRALSSSALDTKQPQPRTGYVYDTVMMLHQHPTEEHPETPERIHQIYKEMRSQGLLSRMKNLIFNPVVRHHAILVHSENHWDKVERLAYMLPQHIEETLTYYEGMSLYVSPDTTRAAKFSCGGVIEACKAVVKGEVRNSFAIVRPPGHHAEPDEHMGFCFFNNVAVAARVVQQELGVKKILILDWDVHHGNGTQKAFNDDPSILYVSIHRYDGGMFYPGGHFGAPTSCGEGPGLGFSVNVAWPDGGMGDAEYLYAFQRLIMPIAMEFAPELVIISAGFDAARGDELGDCDVTPAGYAHMTHMLSSLAGGKVVVALEGGYNLAAIRDSAIAVMRVLLGESIPSLPPMTANVEATETLYQACRIQAKYWTSIKAPPFPTEEDRVATGTMPLPVLLKEHRRWDLYKDFKLLQLPFADQELKGAFEGLVLCSSDIFSQKPLILFVHNFGDLHVELLGERTVNVNIEKSYIDDASRALLGWASGNGYSVIDLNVFANPAEINVSGDALRQGLALQRRVLTYVWDNYIEIKPKPHEVYLLNYAGAAIPVMELLRARDVSTCLKGVAQFVGRSQQPAFVKTQGETLNWFTKNSVVYTGLDPEELGTFPPLMQRGIGRIQRVSAKSMRGTDVIRQSIESLDRLIRSKRPFGEEPPVANSEFPPPLSTDG